MITIERKTSRLAIASIYCALIALFMVFLYIFFALFQVRTLSGYSAVLSALFSVAAFLLAIFALIVIAFRRNEVKGCSYAIISVVLVFPITFLMGCSLLVALLRAERKKENMGTYNLSLLGKEITEYSKENDGFLPIADKWCDLLIKHNSKLTKYNFMHPRADEVGIKGQCHFAFNRNLSGMRLADIPSDVVLVFEADGNWNLSGTDELLKTRYWKDGYITLLFANGKMADYWFYKNAIRKFDKQGGMYYEKPRWKP